MLLVDGTLAPIRDHSIAEKPKNYRYSTHRQAVIDADTRLVVAIGWPVADNLNDCIVWKASSAKAVVGKAMVITDGGHWGIGLVVLHSLPGKRTQ